MLFLTLPWPLPIAFTAPLIAEAEARAIRAVSAEFAEEANLPSYKSQKR
jgi:hypothetical protein